MKNGLKCRKRQVELDVFVTPPTLTFVVVEIVQIYGNNLQKAIYK